MHKGTQEDHAIMKIKVEVVVLQMETYNLTSTYLDRSVRIRVALPSEYTLTDRGYPVLYVHDGQNVFYDAEAYDGIGWDMLGAMNAIKQDIGFIVVAVDNGGAETRLDEYSPFSFEIDAFSDGRKPGGKAEAYLDFLEKEVKPFIDKRYRTLKAPAHTALLGSSMGGVISVYGCLSRSEIFGRAASLSGAFFTAKKQWEIFLDRADFTKITKLYLDTGDKEGGGPASDEDYLAVNTAFIKKIKPRIENAKLVYRIIPDGTHHETAWRKRLVEVLQILWS